MWVVFVFDAFPHTPSTENAEHENHPNTGGFRVRHPSNAEQKITYVFVLINVTLIVIVNKIFLLCHPREHVLQEIEGTCDGYPPPSELPPGSPTIHTHR